jgi:hypothetical protein
LKTTSGRKSKKGEKADVWLFWVDLSLSLSLSSLSLSPVLPNGRNEKNKKEIVDSSTG